jgi:AAHS family 4-hydroxybenzoate transporter-like MFS transporter
VIASVLASRLIPDHGWGIIFVIGGVLPLLLAPFIVLYVPESIRFLSLRRDDAALTKTLARMGIDDEEAAGVKARAMAQVKTRPESGAERTPIWNLFTEGRALGTTLLSLSLFLTLLMAFFLVNWIPTLATQAGIGTSAAILGVGSLNIGGILGSMVISRFSGRFRPGMMISLSYGLGAVAIAVVGQAGTSGTWLLTSTFVAGFLAIGAQMCTVSLLATYYDTRLRATGVGWAMGCGRVGGIIGPTVGGWLVAASFSMGTIFVIAGLVCAACAVTVFGLGRFVLYTRADPTAEVDVPAAKAARTV